MDYTKRTLDFLADSRSLFSGGNVVRCCSTPVTTMPTTTTPTTTTPTITTTTMLTMTTTTTTTTTATKCTQSRKLIVSVPMTLEQRLKGLPIRYMWRQKVIINLLCRRVCELNAIFLSYSNGEQELLLGVNDLCNIFCNWESENLSPLMSFKKTVYRRVRPAYKVSTGQLIQYIGRDKYVVGNDSLSTIYFDEYGFFMLSMLSTRLDTDKIRSSVYATLMDAFGVPLGIQFMRSKRTVDFGVYTRIISDQQEMLVRLHRKYWLEQVRQKNETVVYPFHASH